MKQGDERRSGAGTCRILGCAGGSPDPREEGFARCSLAAHEVSVSRVCVPAVIASLGALPGCSRGCLLCCPPASHTPSKSHTVHAVAAGHR